jgi:uncharacterized protein (TIGR03000 family)
MFRTAHTLGCILVLSVAAVLVTPGLSQAQRGGHGGGGHYSGAHVGGYRGAVHVGGYHAGGYHGDYRYPYARPYYGSYGYYPYLYNTYPSYDSGYFGSYGAAPPYYGDATYGTPSSDTYQAFYPPPAARIPSDTSAQISVSVPAGAEIWFDGAATTSTGTVRQFNSPPLTPGKHAYQIRARWSENGHEATQSQRVEVTPGAQINMSFPIAGKASAVN